MTTMFRSVRPQRHELPAYAWDYAAEVPDGDIVATLRREGERTASWLARLPAGSWKLIPGPGKWSVSQVVLHVVDSERVLSYRALRFARGDRTPLPGFDQDLWVPNSGAGSRAPESLVAEFRAVREASLHLYESVPADGWDREGLANEHPVTVRALAWFVAGHELHHRRLLVERYGLPALPG